MQYEFPLENIAPPRRFNEETNKWEGTHSGFFGRTGWGKTWAAYHMANPNRRFIVIHDGKRTFRDKKFVQEPEWAKCETVDACVKAGNRKDRIIYSPKRGDLRNENEQNRFAEWLLHRGNCLTIYDDILLVSDSNYIPPALEDCFTVGRETGLEIWYCTQQPVNVANICFTQSGAFYVFNTILGTHLQKLRTLLPINMDAVSRLPREQFYAYHNEWPRTLGPLHIEEEAPHNVRLINDAPRLADQAGEEVG